MGCGGTCQKKFIKYRTFSGHKVGSSSDGPSGGIKGLVLGIKEINMKITSFTDLIAWKEGHRLVLVVYSATKIFPKEEIFGLVSQMRRCSISITSNIAEGFSRNSWKEKLQFYSTALGSITELQNQLLVSRDVGYLSKNKFNEIADQTIIVSKLVNGLIKKSRSEIS